MTDVYIREVQAAEMFAPRKLREFLISIEAAPSTDAVWDLLVKLGASLDLNCMDYVYATDFRNWEQAQFVRTTADSTWLDRLREFPHIRKTSNFRMHAVKYLTPILTGIEFTDEYTDISPEKMNHMRICAEYGFRSAVAIPLRMGEPGQAGSISFGGAMGKAEFLELMREHGWTLHAAALSAHARYTELFKAEFIERNQLTEKQKELITLVGQGLMDKQIAHLLDISFSAVRQRLTAVQAKTGAQNRADLAALAMRVGLVADPLLKPHAEELTVFLSTGDGITGSEVRASDTPRATAAE